MSVCASTHRLMLCLRPSSTTHSRARLCRTGPLDRTIPGCKDETALPGAFEDVLEKDAIAAQRNTVAEDLNRMCCRAARDGRAA